MTATLKTTIIQEPSSASSNIQLDASGNTYLVPVTGNVGIGTTSPGTYKLAVYSAASTAAVQILNTGNNQLRLGDNSGTNYFDIGRNTTDGLLQFTGNQGNGYKWINIATEAMRIDSTGALQVGGTTVTNTTGYVNSRTNARAWITFVDNGSVAVSSNYNVSSVTRNAVSDYTLNYATALATATYAFAGMSGANSTSMRVVNQPYNAQAPSTTSLRVVVTSSDGTLAPIGSTEVVSVVVFGN
jgi:hypothetical protein